MKILFRQFEYFVSLLDTSAARTLEVTTSAKATAEGNKMYREHEKDWNV
jgi:hypothetical protein